MKIKKIKIKKLALIILIFFLIIDISMSYFYSYYATNFVESKQCFSGDAAIVFFAGFDDNFFIDTLQKSRLLKSKELFESNKIKNIICVGGNRPESHLNGSRSSAEYLIANGIPKNAVLFDTLSFDTKTNLGEAHKIAKSINADKLIYISDAIHLHRIAQFSDYPNYCLVQNDYQFNFFELIRMTNQSFVSFVLEQILSEQDYIKFIQFFRS